MKRVLGRWIAIWALVLASGAALSQVLAVTEPTSGSFLGLTNSLRFTVNGTNVGVTITVEITGPTGGVTTISDRFTPNANGQIDGTMALNFSESSPTGAYTIEVTGTRNDNMAVFGQVTINVTVDVRKPKFLQFNPLEDSFVRGIVPIVVTLQEDFFRDFRVQVNNQDIPNNTGTTLVNNGFTVLWDADQIQKDGEQDISVRLRDLANNEDTKTISVTLDRVPPSVVITQPNAKVRLNPRSNVSIAIDINDSAGTSVDVSGVDVVVRRLDGTFITRAARQSSVATGDTSMRWSGRVRWTSLLPQEFKIVVSVTDRAGNAAPDQEVIVRYR
jgi:hypothetical protein